MLTALLIISGIPGHHNELHVFKSKLLLTVGLQLENQLCFCTCSLGLDCDRDLANS
jgi:hypothetical protein